MTIEDITHLLDKEQGSAFDLTNILFTAYDDGMVFDYNQFQSTELRDALEIDGKMQTLQRVLTLPIRQATWHIERGEAREEVASAVEAALGQPANNGGMTTPMNTVIAQMCGAITYRKAYFEKVFTVKNGRIVYDKVAWRPPTTCTIQRDPKNGAFRGFRQMPIRLDDTEEVVIPPERAFVYIHGTDTNPLDGKGDLDVALWCYKTKQKIRFLWYQFLEGQSLPKTVVKARSQTVADAAAKKLVGLRSGGIVGLTNDLDVDAFESSGKGADQFKAAMQWLDAEASGSVLAGFTDLGAAAAAGIGSFALSKDQTDFFLMSEESKAREMEDCIGQYLVPDLVRWNFGPDEKVPQFKFSPIAEDDAAQAISLLQAVAVTESPVLPKEFYAELVDKVAAHLDLNSKVVRDGMKRHQDEALAIAEKSGDPEARRVAPVVGAVQGAFNLMQANRANGTDG